MKISPLNYAITFSSSQKNKKPKTATPPQENRTSPKRRPAIFNIPSNIALNYAIMDYKRNFTPEAYTIYKKASNIAKHYNSPTIECKHIWLASLMEFDNLLKDIEENKTEYDPEGRQKFPQAIMEEASVDSSLELNNPKIRKKVQKVVKNNINTLKEAFANEAKTKPKLHTNPIPSKSLIKELDETTTFTNNESNINNMFFDSFFFILALNSMDKKLGKSSNNFVLDIKKALMINDDKEKETKSLDFYSEKADAIWKSADIGNDTVILYDGKTSQSIKYLMNTFSNTINNPENKYKNLNSENTEIIKLNNIADFKLLTKIVQQKNEENKKTGKTTIITGDLGEMISRSMIESSSSQNICAVNIREMNTLYNATSKGEKNPYVRFVFTMDSALYYANMKPSLPLSGILNNYATQTMHSITSSDTKEHLVSENGIKYLENKFGKKIEKNAIIKAIDLTNDEKGEYPDKVLNLLNKVSKYFVEENTLTEEQVISFIFEMQKLTETSSNEENVDIIYETGKTLNDIVGSQMTKETAEAVANEIKTNPKTKGYLIYQSYTAKDGGGRRNTAEAIAGEANIPMITINAKEFLMKDLSSLYQDPNLAELKIKSLITKIKAQAKTTPNKTAMVFIENFDNFATDPYKGFYPSNYEQKAFSQLLTEMEKAKKENNVNLVVVGSVNNRQVIDDNILKPGKFIDEIVIYPPQDDKERKEVFDYYIEKDKIKIKGDKKEQEEIINHAASMSSGFRVVDIMYMLESANNVAVERGKNSIDKSDFTEAYLRMQFGRPNKSFVSKHRKKIVTSHEIGHALTLQIMYNIAKNQDPWCLPNKVNFITLDARGYYGGAMYPIDGGNDEYTFEKIMSDIVCDYGGHSSEKTLYDYTGSWGITADMEMARNWAESAVVDMGMGAKTGVRHINRDILGKLDISEKQKQTIEDDEELILSGAEKISDRIVSEYKDFIEELTEKYYQKVGSGDCIITSEEFNSELENWKNKQPKEKQEELEFLEEKIASAVNKIKHGEKVTSI